MKMMICENCAFYDEDMENQPCCNCHGQNFEVEAVEGEDEVPKVNKQ